MTDTLRLYTAAEALELAPDERDRALRVILAQAPGAEVDHLGGHEGVLRMARLMLCERAVMVRCTRRCEHKTRYAILGYGVDCCSPCRFRFADAKARGDGRCDTCNARAKELEGVKYQLRGNVVLPDGSTQASVQVNARVCGDCLALLESVPGASQAASWN
jgi:hypothetical protein